jgi:two-component system LytT family sensor kinase
MICSAYIQPKDKWTRIIGIPLLGLSIPFIFNNPIIFDLKTYCFHALISLISTLVLWQGNRQLVVVMRHRFPDYRQTGKRIIAQSLASLLFTTGAFLIIYYLQLYLFSGGRFNIYAFIGEIKVALIVTMLVTTIYESVYFFNMWKNSIVEAEELKRTNIQSQFETLKNQVNPHFLFNSLNTLITIIPENQELAMEFVQKLSNVFRYLLQNNSKEVVSLRTELDVVEAYLFLVKIRFGENLYINMQVPEHFLDWHIAPLTLQMLLENVIKHNIISTDKPLTVDIYVEKDTLIVKNNLQRKNSRETSTKVGLQNIINRYKYLSDREVEVIVTSSSFIVALPLIRIKQESAIYESAPY